MAILYLLFVSAGLILGTKFKVLVLVPATALSALALIGGGVASGRGLGSLLLMAFLASACLQRTAQLAASLCRVAGVRPAFTAPRFHEAVLLLDRPVTPVLAALAGRGIFGGLDLTGRYPELGHALLVCATETKIAADIESYAGALADIMNPSRAAA